MPGSPGMPGRRLRP